MFFTARKAVDVCRDMVTNVQVSKNAMFRLHSTLAQHRFSINDTNLQASGSLTRENCAVSNGWEIRLPPMTTIHSNDDFVSKKLVHHTLFKGVKPPTARPHQILVPRRCIITYQTAK